MDIDNGLVLNDEALLADSAGSSSGVGLRFVGSCGKCSVN